uniref:Uncharacterized protein n=1 Tax=Melanopsichium pennsylvanicum 4 TaxID=1398559 RepID=A0A077R951_9BASI|nr:uncharacterized protein BN887_04410 [Melanopsichium pennsylvanicum 4]
MKGVHQELLSWFAFAVLLIVDDGRTEALRGGMLMPLAAIPELGLVVVDVGGGIIMETEPDVLAIGLVVESGLGPKPIPWPGLIPRAATSPDAILANIVSVPILVIPVPVPPIPIPPTLAVGTPKLPKLPLSAPKAMLCAGSLVNPAWIISFFATSKVQSSQTYPVPPKPKC